MRFQLLETVVLDRDIPDHGLRVGDLGAIVECYEPDVVEVEFTIASGRTQALLTLPISDLRPIDDSDIMAARPVQARDTA